MTRKDPHLDESLLLELAEGLLPPSESARAETHVAHCPACAEKLREHRAYFAALSGLPTVTPPEDLLQRIRGELDSQTAKKRPSHRTQARVRFLPRLFEVWEHWGKGARLPLGFAGAALSLLVFGIAIRTFSPESMPPERLDFASETKSETAPESRNAPQPPSAPELQTEPEHSAKSKRAFAPKPASEPQRKVAPEPASQPKRASIPEPAFEPEPVPAREPASELRLASEPEPPPAPMAQSALKKSYRSAPSADMVAESAESDRLEEVSESLGATLGERDEGQPKSNKGTHRLRVKAEDSRRSAASSGELAGYAEPQRESDATEPDSSSAIRSVIQKLGGRVLPTIPHPTGIVLDATSSTSLALIPRNRYPELLDRLGSRIRLSSRKDSLGSDYADSVLVEFQR